MVKETENTVKTVRASRKTTETATTRKSASSSRETAPDNNKVGSLLYNERQKKGLELTEISRALCIRRFYLEAIEKGNYGDLLPMPYSVGFVSSYAKYLGLNHTRIAQLFREEINEKPNKNQVFIADDTPSEVPVPNKIYVIGGIILVLLIAALWHLLSPSSSSEKAPEEPALSSVDEHHQPSSAEEVEYFETQKEPEKKDDISDNSIKENIVEVKDAPIAPQQIIMSNESYVEPTAEKEVPVSSGIEVKITKENTWIEVRDSKKIYISKILKVGDTYRLPDTKGLILSSGKYEGVEVYINGKLTPVIKPNRKMRISLDKFLNKNH